MPRKNTINTQTQEILVLLAAGLSCLEVANTCHVTAAWVYAVAKREMKRTGATDFKELLSLYCEQQLQRAQEMRIAAEKLILLAEGIEATNHKLLNKAQTHQEVTNLGSQVSIAVT